MKRLLLKLCGLLAVLGLTGCNDYLAERELKPGISTAAEVRDRLGAPTMEWRNDDGSVTWEFARTPEGLRNYMVTIGKDNIMQSMQQVITQENFARIQAGMSHDQVRRILGKPGRIMQLHIKQQEVWDWMYVDETRHEMHFNVHFGPDGNVAETSKSDETKG